MKYFEIIVSKILIYIAYIFTYLIPVKKNRVSIISYFNEDEGLEFKGLINLLEKDDIEIKKSFHKFKGTYWGKFKYLFSFMYQTYLFNTSRVIVLDGNSYVYASIKTKRKVQTVQLWHATGAIKKFGMETDRRYKIKGYDNLVVSSNYFVDIFSKSLNTKKENTHPLGNIKTDYLFDKDYLESLKEDFYKRNPELKDKKLILYAPTFRGDGIEDMSYQESDISELQTLLGNEYKVVVRLHPLTKNKPKNVLELPNEDLYTLLYVSEYIISDYSALIFDSIILKKKIVLYLYDLNEYEMNRGLCVDLNKINLEKAYKIVDIYDIILSEVCNINYSELMDKYLDTIDGNSTNRIHKYILNLIRGNLDV